METQPEKTFCMFELLVHSTKSVTTVQWAFRRNFYKNLPLVNSVHFLVLSRHFTAMATAALLVVTSPAD
jgi:hypothetical protein